MRDCSRQGAKAMSRTGYVRIMLECVQGLIQTKISASMQKLCSLSLDDADLRQLENPFDSRLTYHRLNSTRYHSSHI